MSPEQYFLHVKKSLAGQPWRSRLDPSRRAQAEAIVQQHGLSDILARVLAGRGVGPGEALAFLEPTVRDLMPDPDSLQDMGKACARLALAAQRGEKVAIFGDYDVDGACSAALLGSWLEACGLDYVIHIPDRIFEGYGPNIPAIKALAGQGASLLVTADCGTASFEPFGEARRLGMDVVVLDHHQAPEQLPDVVALVNPNREDDLSGLGHLCAAGVVFMTLAGVNRMLRAQNFWTVERPQPDLLALLDLVALATVADVVPLKGLNRAFVRTGLSVMRQRNRAGLRALFDVAGANGPPKASMLGFMIGPRINAGGRIGDAALGAKLLLLQDDSEAAAIARELDRLNRERQEIELATLAEAEAEALAAAADQEGQTAVVTAGEGWHPGVAGLVAARLKERFNKPAFAIAFAGENGTGSGRSIAGVDVGRAVRAAVDAGIAVRGGGHAMAAGVTIKRGQLGAFRAFLEETLGAAVEEARREGGLIIDAAITAGGAQAQLVHDIEKAGPFGQGQPEPVFAFPAHQLRDVGVVGAGHVRMRFTAGDRQSLNAIAFRAENKPLGQALLKSRDRFLHVAGTLNLDHWGGSERVQLRVLDAAVPEDNRPD